MGGSRRTAVIGINRVSGLVYKRKIEKGEHLILPGIGSGVATYALLMAKAIGATVSVTSRSENKNKPR